MGNEGKAYNMQKSVNQFILTIITIMDLFLFVGYFNDYSKGNIGLGFFLTIELIVLISMIADYAVFFSAEGRSYIQACLCDRIYDYVCHCPVGSAE